MAKLRKDEYWAILDEQGKLTLCDNQLMLRKTRGELLDYAKYLYYDNDKIKQMVYNGQTEGAFPKIAKIKLTYQII